MRQNLPDLRPALLHMDRATAFAEHSIRAPICEWARRVRLGHRVPAVLRPLRVRVLRGADGDAREPGVARPGEIRDLAHALKSLLVRYDNLWRMPFPFAMTLHQAPADGADHAGFHFHVESR
jgi:hypothetical protein